MESNQAPVALVDGRRSEGAGPGLNPQIVECADRLAVRPALEAVLGCPRCHTRLSARLRCGACGFHLSARQGVLVCSPEPRNHAFENYSQDCGLPQYAGLKLVEHEYYLRFIPESPGAIAVDCGGGDANASALWARRNPDSELVVADMDRFALRKALMRNLPNLTPVQTPALSLPFTNGSIDCVFTTFMVEHMYDWELSRFYLEARRVLRSGGSLIVQSDSAFFDKFIHPALRMIKRERRPRTHFLDRWRTHIRSVHHHNLKTGEAQRQIIKDHGFFIQGMEVPLLFSNRVFFAGVYEVLGGVLPASLLSRFLGTSYTVVATKLSA